MYFSGFLTIFALFAVLVPLGNAFPDERLLNGQDVDTLRQFPFFVYIIAGYRRCGGSILNDRWILTSAECVRGYTRLDLNFEMKNQLDRTAEYFTISVNADQVYPYPTNHDDLALIKIPTRLIFSDTLNPVQISNSSIDSLRNKFAVLPGFDSYDEYDETEIPNRPDNLKYGTFNILDQTACKQDLAGYAFNEYNQLCAEAWGNNPNVPCFKDIGGPLVVGWPAKTELVGIYSIVADICSRQHPTVYTFVPKYLTWIQTMIQA